MNDKIKTVNMSILLMALAFLFGGCQDNGDTGWTPDMIPDDPVAEEPDSGGNDEYLIPIDRAPLYWSIYEYCREQEQSGVSNQDMDMTAAQWTEVAEWVSENFKPYGYNMLCTDGFIPMTNQMAVNADGYMTHYGSMKLTDLVSICKQNGLYLGVYDNPLWLHAENMDAEVSGGGGVTFRDLMYSVGDPVEYEDVEGDLFNWVIPSHAGAKEYIDGFFKYYADLGVRYIRADFFCHFESGSREQGMTCRGYGRDEYLLALQYINEAAKKYKVFFSIVMPNMKNVGEAEKTYCNMARIDADVFDGGWDHISGRNRGNLNVDHWPTCDNMFDGFIYWSQISGKGNIILDGDFTRLNTLSNDDEKETAISIQLLAGGPVAIADLENSLAVADYHFYQNEEMLALNTEGFVGKPKVVNVAVNRIDNQIWYGQTANGDYIVGLFNRNDGEEERSVNFKDLLGVEGQLNVRDLWKQEDEGAAEELTVTLRPHACKIVRLSKP